MRGLIRAPFIIVSTTGETHRLYEDLLVVIGTEILITTVTDEGAALFFTPYQWLYYIGVHCVPSTVLKYCTC